jgi:ribokinase
MTPESYDVIVCGSLHLDIMVKAQHLPQSDETAIGSEWAYKCGGKGRNQAEMAARMGAKTAMIGRIGSDDFGVRLIESLDQARVDRSQVSVDPATGSGMSVAILESSGNYGAVIVSGSNLKLDPSAACQSWDALGSGTVLILQNEVPEPINIALARLARKQGAKVLLNAAPARPMAQELLDQIDILVVNRVEAAMLAGIPVENLADASKAASNLKREALDVIVTLGGDGLLLRLRNGAEIAVMAEQVNVVSTHGAGDSFIGALGAKLAAGAPLEAATRHASRLAGYFVSLSEAEKEAADLSSR